MEIIRNLDTDGNFNTKLYNLLNSIEESIIHRDEFKNLRHPRSIYSISTERVYSAFNNFIKKFKNIKDVNNTYDIESVNNIQTAHNEVICSIMAYIDDIYLIMKSFYPSTIVKSNTEVAVQWLKKADFEIIKDYQNDIFKYTEKYNKIDNKIKHNHARYCFIKYITKYKGIYGYYINGLTKQALRKILCKLVSFRNENL